MENILMPTTVSLVALTDKSKKHILGKCQQQVKAVSVTVMPHTNWKVQKSTTMLKISKGDNFVVCNTRA